MNPQEAKKTEFLHHYYDLAKAAYANMPEAIKGLANTARTMGLYANFRNDNYILNNLKPFWMGIKSEVAPHEETRQSCILLIEERLRQMEEDDLRRPEDDDTLWRNGELADAAACYITDPEQRELNELGIPKMWPWGIEAWHPTPGNRVKELQKGGALLLSEIERLKRLETKKLSNNN